MLTLDLPDSDGEPRENEREQFQMLLRDSLMQHWRGRQDVYVAGHMFVYYSAKQVRTL